VKIGSFGYLWRLIPRSASKEFKDKVLCEFQSYQAYETGYRCLASALGRPDKNPGQGELERIRRLIDRRGNPAGSLSIPDCLFAAAFVSITRPHRMVEIGTGSGFSSALLACAIHLQRPDARAPCVDTLDAHAEYFGESNLPVGFDISNLIPEFPGSVRVHAPRESDFVGTLAAKDELELAFIDGNHQHPLPLLDVLRIAPYVKGGGWVLLHDIRFGTIVETARQKGVPLPYEGLFGAEWLFDEWAWNKIDGGNIGAIQLPTKKKAILRSMGTLMNSPFEVCKESYRRLRDEVREAARFCAR